jgi:hypothetical protein
MSVSESFPAVVFLPCPDPRTVRRAAWLQAATADDYSRPVARLPGCPVARLPAHTLSPAVARRGPLLLGRALQRLSLLVRTVGYRINPAANR